MVYHLLRKDFYFKVIFLHQLCTCCVVCVFFNVGLFGDRKMRKGSAGERDIDITWNAFHSADSELCSLQKGHNGAERAVTLELCLFSPSAVMLQMGPSAEQWLEVTITLPSSQQSATEQSPWNNVSWNDEVCLFYASIRILIVCSWF